MRRLQHINLPTERPLWRLSLLLVTLASSAMATAGQAPAVPNGHGAGAQTTYRVTNLGSGFLATIPSINARGQVAFSASPLGGGPQMGYFYDGNTVQNIGTLGGSDTLVNGLNNQGQIAGASYTFFGGQRAFFWQAGAGMLDIGGPFGGSSFAYAINNRGIVVGGAIQNNNEAFRWSLAGGFENLGSLIPYGGSHATALNDAGVIAGLSRVTSGHGHAFRWSRHTGMVDIDTLDSEDARPNVVGPNGEVAGNRLPSLLSQYYVGFLWTAATGMVDLVTAGGILPMSSA